MNRPIHTYPPYWEQAKTELCRIDKTLGTIIKRYEGETLRSRGDAFQTLCRSIVGQQISVKAADAVWEKFSSHIGSITPERICKANPDALRTTGLSQRKTEYMRHIADFFVEEKVDQAFWESRNDYEVTQALTSIRGIGKWTAEMFLIFYLMRQDVLPIDDIGLQKAVWRLYNKDQPLTKADLHDIAKSWKPWRTVATWYLWRSLDPTVVEY